MNKLPGHVRYGDIENETIFFFKYQRLNVEFIKSILLLQ
jgi:hypothetical protein